MTMSNPTYVKLTGWVTRDPELRKTNENQTSVCTIRVGTANRWPDRTTGEWREGPASYFDVVCWRALADNVAASLRKGHMVTIHGTFRNRIWTDKDNTLRTSLEITASSVGHELTFGWSHFNRTQRALSRAAEELAEGESSRGLDSGQGFASGQDPDSGQDDENPFDPGQYPDAAPADLAAYGPGNGQGGLPGGEPAGERVFGAGDEGGADDAGTAEAAEGEPRLEEVAVPV
jgi:single-strand DNA-binding protein